MRPGLLRRAGRRILSYLGSKRGAVGPIGGKGKSEKFADHTYSGPVDQKSAMQKLGYVQFVEKLREISKADKGSLGRYRTGEKPPEEFVAYVNKFVQECIKTGKLPLAKDGSLMSVGEIGRMVNTFKLINPAAAADFEAAFRRNELK
ncbi:MAG: hypothetical protein V1494_06410 [Candidatus Diapherotrites archaeon]